MLLQVRTRIGFGILNNFTGLRASIHDLRVVVVDGATHAIPQDKPEEFEREVKVFIASLK